MRFDEARLVAALEAVPARSWHQPSHITTNGVHHLYSRARIIAHSKPRGPAHLFQWVFDEFDAPVSYAALTRLEPGGFIVPHRDTGPYLERWHVPILAAGRWGDGTTPQPGVPHRIQQWLPHSVWNDTDQPRVHLLVDLEREAHPSEPFELYPIPGEYQRLVDAAQEVPHHNG